MNAHKEVVPGASCFGARKQEEATKLRSARLLVHEDYSLDRYNTLESNRVCEPDQGIIAISLTHCHLDESKCSVRPLASRMISPKSGVPLLQ